MRHSSTFRFRTLSLELAGIALVGFIGLAACGGGAKTSSPTAAAVGGAVAPEAIKVSSAVVAAGLTRLPATLASAIAAIGTPQAATKVAAIEQQWATFEGTVRDTDPDIYLAIEDQLNPVQDQIKAGDAAKAAATATTLSDLFAQYLTKHPA